MIQIWSSRVKSSFMREMGRKGGTRVTVIRSNVQRRYGSALILLTECTTTAKVILRGVTKVMYLRKIQARRILSLWLYDADLILPFYSCCVFALGSPVAIEDERGIKLMDPTP